MSNEPLKETRYPAWSRTSGRSVTFESRRTTWKTLTLNGPDINGEIEIEIEGDEQQTHAFWIPLEQFKSAVEYVLADSTGDYRLDDSERARP